MRISKGGQNNLEFPGRAFLQTPEATSSATTNVVGLNGVIPLAPVQAVMHQLEAGEQSYHSVMESEQKCILSSHHFPCKSTEMGLISGEYACVPQ